MPIKTSWYLKDKIILLEMIDVVSEEEYASMIRTSPANLPDAPVIHTVIDIQQLEVSPNATPDMKFMASQTPANKNSRWVMFIQRENSSVGRFIISVTMQILRIKFRFVNSLQEALDALTQLDPNIPPLVALDSYEDLEVIDYIEAYKDKAV